METSKGGNYAHPVIQTNPKEMMEEQNTYLHLLMNMSTDKLVGRNGR